MNTNIKKCNNTSENLWKKLDELDALEENTDIIKTWVQNCDISFKNEDNATLDLSDIYGKILMDTGTAPTKEELEELIRGFANKKETFKSAAKDKKKQKAVSAGALNVYSGQGTEIQLQTQIFNKSVNKHDMDLFSNFRQCGSSIVLVDNGRVLLCVEDAKGNIKIPNKESLKGAIARNVEESFVFKFKKYLNDLNKFLVDLEDRETNESSEDYSPSPIEDYFETEIPISMSKLVKIYQYEENIGDQKKPVLIYHWRAKPRNDFEHVDNVFAYCLNNWTKFKKAINGQSEFYAWSNDRTVTSASYWTLPTEEVRCPDAWLKFLKAKFDGDGHLMRRLVTYLGMTMDASNRAQQYLIISDKGGTGKDFFGSILTESLPNNSVGNINSSVFENDNRFGLANTEVWKSHMSIIHELNDSKNLMTENAKKFFGQNRMDLEVKNAGCVSWNPINHKTLIFSNRKIAIKETANRRRAIPIVFNNMLTKLTDNLDAFREELKTSAKQFLDFCYCMYKKEKLMHNGEYVVLCKEDEDKFLSGEISISDINADWDKYSRRAFNEECLKDYYNTDDYSDSEEVQEVWNPIIEELFEITNKEEDYITSSDLRNTLEEWIGTHPRYAHDLGLRVYQERVEIGIRSKEWFKFCSTITDVKLGSVSKKVKRIGKRTVQTFFGLKLKHPTEQLTDELSNISQTDLFVKPKFNIDFT